MCKEEYVMYYMQRREYILRFEKLFLQVMSGNILGV